MERQVLDVNAPLYNRRTGAMKLDPLDYTEAALFFPDYSLQEKMEAYAILGGMPSYLEQFDPKQSLEENVKRTICGAIPISPRSRTGCCGGPISDTVPVPKS